LGGNPNGLTLASSTCSPFTLDFACSTIGLEACAIPGSAGYTRFTITP
jgi:hypothetical protein